jgi:hypothetical protein
MHHTIPVSFSHRLNREEKIEFPNGIATSHVFGTSFCLSVIGTNLEFRFAMQQFTFVRIANASWFAR